MLHGWKGQPLEKTDGDWPGACVVEDLRQALLSAHHPVSSRLGEGASGQKGMWPNELLDAMFDPWMF